jgi:hypothetical protein
MLLLEIDVIGIAGNKLHYTTSSLAGPSPRNTDGRKGLLDGRPHSLVSPGRLL